MTTYSETIGSTYAGVAGSTYSDAGVADHELTLHYYLVADLVRTSPIIQAPRPSERFANRLMRHFRSPDAGVNVFLTTDGEYTTQQPVYWSQVAKVWYGGHVNELTAEEATALEAAGFTVISRYE